MENMYKTNFKQGHKCKNASWLIPRTESIF